MTFLGLIFSADSLISASVAYIHYLSFMLCFGAFIYDKDGRKIRIWTLCYFKEYETNFQSSESISYKDQSIIIKFKDGFCKSDDYEFI